MKDNSNYQGKNTTIIYSQEEVAAFMKKIKLEFYSFLNLNFSKNKKNESKANSSYTSSDGDNTKLYYLKYIKYMINDFNSTIVNMMILYINHNNSFPETYKKEQDFIYNMIRLLKNLMMNEIEVAYFTLLIDKLGWANENIEHWIYFTILGIITKNGCNTDNDSILLIDKYSKKYFGFHDIYSNFINNESISSLINEKSITVNLINKRFIELSKPINTYCTKNFIKLEGIIDEIISMSHPYLKTIPNIIKTKTNDDNDSINTPTENNRYDNLFNDINKQNKGFNFDDIKNIDDGISDWLNNDEFFDFMGKNEIYDSLKFEDI